MLTNVSVMPVLANNTYVMEKYYPTKVRTITYLHIHLVLTVLLFQVVRFCAEHSESLGDIVKPSHMDVICKIVDQLGEGEDTVSNNVYYRRSESDIGRFYARSSLPCFQNMPGWLRYEFLQGFRPEDQPPVDYFEIDMCSAFQTLMQELLAKADCAYLDPFGDQWVSVSKPALIDVIVQRYAFGDANNPVAIDKDQAKTFLTALCYGGTAFCCSRETPGASVQFTLIKSGDQWLPLTRVNALRHFPQELRLFSNSIGVMNRTLLENLEAIVDFDFGDLSYEVFKSKDLSIHQWLFHAESIALTIVSKCLADRFAQAGLEFVAYVHDGMIIGLPQGCDVDQDQLVDIVNESIIAHQDFSRGNLRCKLKPLTRHELPRRIADSVGQESLLDESIRALVTEYQDQDFKSAMEAIVIASKVDVYKINLTPSESLMIHIINDFIESYMEPDCSDMKTAMLVLGQMIKSCILQVWSTFNQTVEKERNMIEKKAYNLLSEMTAWAADNLTDDSEESTIASKLIKQCEKIIVAPSTTLRRISIHTERKSVLSNKMTPFKDVYSGKLVALSKHLSKHGYRQPSSINFRTIDRNNIDYDINATPNPLERRPDYLAHMPNFTKVLSYTNLPHFVGQWLRMDRAGRLTEISRTRVQVFVEPQSLDSFRLDLADNGLDGFRDGLLSSLDFVDDEWENVVVTEPFAASYAHVRYPNLCSGFSCTGQPMVGSGKNLLELIDYHGNDITVKSYGYYPLRAKIDPALINIGQYPLYCHTLRGELQDLFKINVPDEMRDCMDRLFCHLAGCKVCHCRSCVTQDIEKGYCHFCDKVFHNDDPDICMHLQSSACSLRRFKQRSTLCWRLKMWYQFVIRYPRTPVKIAVMLYSAEGGQGKTTLMDNIPKFLIGDELVFVDQSLDAIVRHFNSHLEGKRLVSINEAQGRSIKTNCTEILKGMVDSTSLQRTKKGHDTATIEFNAAIMLSTNWLSNLPFGNRDEARKFMGFEAGKKSERPCYESEVLGYIYGKMLRPDANEVTQATVRRQLMAYITQIDPYGTMEFVPDANVDEYPLLQKLARLSDDGRMEQYVYESMLSPLKDYISKNHAESLTAPNSTSFQVIVNPKGNSQCPLYSPKNARTDGIVTAILDNVHSKQSFENILDKMNIGHTQEQKLDQAKVSSEHSDNSVIRFTFHGGPNQHPQPGEWIFPQQDSLHRAIWWVISPTQLITAIRTIRGRHYC